jgi:hypothetical protein
MCLYMKLKDICVQNVHAFLFFKLIIYLSEFGHLNTKRPDRSTGVPENLTVLEI